MTVPDPGNYWHEQNERRRQVRTRRGGSGWAASGSTQRAAASSGNGRAAVNNRAGRRRGPDPGPPPGRGRLEGTTHTIRPARRRRRRWFPRPRRRSFGRLKFGGPITMAWSAVTLILGAGALIAQTAAWLTFTGVSLGVTTLVGVVEARTRRSPAPAPPRKSPNAPGNARSGSPGRSSGSPKQPGAGKKSSSGGARRCSDGCKRSPKPKSTCRCRATKCEHGSLAGTGTP